MKTRSAKNKGKRLQNSIRNRILEHFPAALEADDVKSTTMGEAGVDLLLSPAAKKLFPYSIECKNQEKLSIWSALRQAELNAKEGTTSLLVFSRNRTPEPYVALKLSDFMKLIPQTPYLTNQI